MAQLFTNNAKTTISGAILAADVTINVATGDGALFASPANGDYQLATLKDGATIEIVKITARTTDALTVTRAQEGTTAQDFPDGATIFAGVTKGTMEKLVHLEGDGKIAIGLGSIVKNSAAIALGEHSGDYSGGNTLTRTPSQTVARYDVAEDAGVRYVCLRGGVTGSGALPAISTGGTGLDGTVIWWSLGPRENGTISIGDWAESSDGVALGNGAYGIGTQVGHFAAADRLGVALGYDVGVYAYKGIAIGPFAKNYNTPYALALRGLPVMAQEAWRGGAEYKTNTGLVGLLSSMPLDLTGGPSWQASTAYSHGSIVAPTTPNGHQYLRLDDNHNAEHDPHYIDYAPASSGATEPTWSTGFAQYNYNDGGGDWVSFPHDGSYVMSLAADMVIEEVMFICHRASGVTAQANISIGTTGDLTKVINNQPTVGLTADKTVTKWTLAQPVMVPDITIKIDTLAAGAHMVGRFYFKGFYAKEGTAP